MHTLSQISVTEMMLECIQECQICHNICLESAIYCLEMGGKHAKAEHVRLLMDCAEICQTSANYMLRGSDLHPQICSVCVDVCERCLEMCDQFPDDEMMGNCSQACRSCAQSCREMAGR